MQVKLNELIAVNRKASNRLLNVEDLSEDEIRALHRFFGELAERAKTETSLSISHSIEEAEEIHQEKVENFHLLKSNRLRDRDATVSAAERKKRSSRKTPPSSDSQ